MGVAEVVDVLRCPVCRQPFALADGGVTCPARHRFDLARQGHLNLLRGPAPRNADTPAMVAARARFLDGGWYAPVADALVAAAAGAPGDRVASPTILEPGAGTGWYTAALVRGLGGRGVALDVSVAAARRAARVHPRVAAVVADAWAGLPLADHGVDVVASVFAPRNPAEFGRVLRPAGVLAVVAPLPDHLAGLRQALGLLEVEPGKQERLAAGLSRYLRPVGEQVVRYPVALPTAAVADLVGMGPNAFHRDPAALERAVAGLPDPFPATVAVAVSSWSPR